MTAVAGVFETSVRRRYAAPRDAVCAAWLDAEGMRRWLSPSGFDLADVELDATVGGRLVVLMRHGKGRWENRGAFVTLDSPDRIAFTWSSDASGDAPTLVTVTCSAAGDGGTDLELTHARLPSADVATNHERGWQEILENLDDWLAAR